MRKREDTQRVLDQGGWLCYATVMQFYIDGDNVHQKGGAHRRNRTIIEQAQQICGWETPVVGPTAKGRQSQGVVLVRLHNGGYPPTYLDKADSHTTPTYTQNTTKPSSVPRHRQASGTRYFSTSLGGFWRRRSVGSRSTRRWPWTRCRGMRITYHRTL